VAALTRYGAPGSTIDQMSSPKIQVLIELEPGTEPITGTLQQPSSGDRNQFTGWLQLTQLLEAIRSSTIEDRLEGTKSASARP